jgi:hypothetical protein
MTKHLHSLKKAFFVPLICCCISITPCAEAQRMISVGAEGSEKRADWSTSIAALGSAAVVHERPGKRESLNDI